MVVVIRKPRHNAVVTLNSFGSLVEVSGEKAPEAIEKNRAFRREVVRNHLAVIAREMPHAEKAAAKEWKRGRATLRMEALEEDRARLQRELRTL